MTDPAARWRRIEQLCAAALERAGGERVAFLRDACGDDEALRHEVEQLLAQDAQADGFLHGRVAAVAAGVMTPAPVQDGDFQQSLTMVTLDDSPRPPDRYTLTRLHASGGIGRIWLARDTAFGRNVALKELRPEFGALDIHRRRFVQEARITGQLEHPGIVPVYESALRSHDQQPFYTMRFVKGRTLAEAARKHHYNRARGQAGMLELVPLLNAFVTVCNTVAYAHSRGVIHRDLKGENVVLGDFGEVVVLDWGLAKLVDQVQGGLADPLLSDQANSSESGLTVDGQMMGTPAYMAPEQASGRSDLIDRHTDIYGLGAILYEVLTGSPPFSGSDNYEILRKVREEHPLPVRELWAEVPPALEGMCLRALAKSPHDRFASASELATAVQNWQEVERREAEEDRDRFFTLAIDLLCIAGFDGYFKRVNPGFERTLGFTSDEMLREPFLNFVHPDDREGTKAAAATIAADTNLMTFENRYRCKDGSYRRMQWSARAFHARQLIYAVARDITDLKRAEALEKN